MGWVSFLDLRQFISGSENRLISNFIQHCVILLSFPIWRALGAVHTFVKAGWSVFSPVSPPSLPTDSKDGWSSLISRKVVSNGRCL